MSTKRTIINADEELVIKGKLTIEGNVTQIETTQQVTNLQGNVFTINSDGSDTSAILALNSNGTVASFTFDAAGDGIVVNTPIIFTSGNVTAPIFVGNVTGNVTGDVTGQVSDISNHTTTDLTEGANLYYTIPRANSAIDARLPNTDALTEGPTNLYYTVARANTAVETYLSGGDGVDYANGIIAVDSTVVRTSGDQTISGEKTFTGQVNISANIIPTTSNTFSIGTTDFHIQDIFANVIHAEILDLGDADLSDIHATFYAGTPSGNIVNENTSTAGGLIYEHSAPGEINAGGYYRVNAGDGLEIDGNAVAVDSTVVRTSGDQTITGNINLTGNLAITGNLDVSANINSLNVVDLNVQDTQIILNANADTGANSSILVNRGSTGSNTYLRWDETADRWKFTNDGTNDNNMLLFTDFSAGNGLSYNNAGEYSVVAGDGISVGANIAVDPNVVVRTSGDQSIAGAKTFTGELIIPGTATTSNAAIYARGPQVFAYLNGEERELTPQVDIGVVTTADVGDLGIDIYAGLDIVGNVTTHFIRSINSGTYTTATLDANVITIEGNIAAIKNEFSTANIAGFGNLSYNSNNGVFSYAGVTESQIRARFSGSGLISYNSSTGAITTTADNYSSWTVQTESGAAKTISSAETLTINGGTNITVTNTGNVITITNDNTADITGVSAGSGLTGGGDNGAVTLNVGAGEGITVNSDNVAVNVAYVRNQFSAGGDLSYNASTGVFSFTNDEGDIESVTAGSGLTGGGTTGAVTLNVGAGEGITVNADNVAVNSSFIRGLVSVTDAGGDGSLAYNSSTGVITYTGPNQTEANARIDARLSGGTGITYNSGVIAAINNGTVTSVGGTGTVNGLTLTGTVTSSGSLTLGGTLAIAATQVTSGTLAVARGGTGVTTSTGTGSVVLSTSPTLVTPILGTPQSATLTNATGLPTAGLVDNAVTDAKLRDSAALSVMGRSANSTGDPADIAAGTDHQVLRRSGTTLAFGAISLNQSAAVTGTLDVANGGTGRATLTSGNYLKGAGTGAIGMQSGIPGEDITSGTISNARTTAVSTLTPNTIVLRDASGNFAANVITATATSARYADLAENYQADAEYAPGTVLIFGGEAEVTECTNFESTRVAGVVTTQPAHVMNSGLTGPNVACIALRGRVPVLVKGVARKGDVLVTAGEGFRGYAVATMYPRSTPAASIVGKVIEDKLYPEPGLVEALI